VTERHGDRGIIAAIHAGALPAYARRTLDDPDADAEHRQRAALALASCERIGAQIDAERERVAALLAAAGTPVGAPGPGGPAQRHEITLEVAPEQVDRAIAVLESDAYRRRHRWSDGAERSLRRTSHEVVLTTSNEVTTVIRLRWRAPHVRGRLARAFSPTPADWDLVDLPTWSWWAYSAVRPVRLVLERAGLRDRDHAALEPFLVTPRSLVGPLLDAAQVGPTDVLLDFGCGDGRLVVEAVRQRGCRAIGVEQSERLAALAVERSEASGLGDRVNIIHGDGLGERLDGVTIVMTFLPMTIARRVVPELIERLPADARLVLHEQGRLAAGLPDPDRSTAVIGVDALTVAHCWNASTRR
jgi:SAM-dependent methyltransferase